jgi:hypothetical protein
MIYSQLFQISPGLRLCPTRTLKSSDLEILVFVWVAFQNFDANEDRNALIECIAVEK